MSGTSEIPLALCYPSEDARTVDSAAVKRLAASIAEVGLMNPISVRRATKVRAGRDADAFEVLAGMHRVKAFRQLGRETIPAFIFEADDLHAALMLIDENLCRNDLTPAQRAAQLAKRKRIYEALHPETAHGASGGGHPKRRVAKLATLDDADGEPAARFTEATAEATGSSERTVQRETARGEALGEDALQRIAHTSLDSGEELDALAKLPENQRKQLIDRAAAGEKVSAKRVNGARSIMGSRAEPDDSLDYFPTPPWATRALFKHVLPEIGADPEYFNAAWEPACGEGHIAEVLEEYFQVVAASDVFDYRYNDSRVIDFLKSDEKPGVGCDWIITNPPFGDQAEAFVLRALQHADIGVAMFFRLQWLETIGRFERIFRPYPPAIIAQFAERVPLHKGRWEPDGSTATAYLWIVWTKDWSPLATKTQFSWIPPGCKDALTRPDDHERFTTHPVLHLERGERLDPATGEIEETESRAKAEEAVRPDKAQAEGMLPRGDGGTEFKVTDDAASRLAAGRTAATTSENGRDGGERPAPDQASPAELAMLTGSMQAEDDLLIPDFLKRDQDNRAPFMRGAVE